MCVESTAAQAAGRRRRAGDVAIGRNEHERLVGHFDEDCARGLSGSFAARRLERVVSIESRDRARDFDDAFQHAAGQFAQCRVTAAAQRGSGQCVQVLVAIRKRFQLRRLAGIDNHALFQSWKARPKAQTTSLSLSEFRAAGRFGAQFVDFSGFVHSRWANAACRLCSIAMFAACNYNI